MVYCLLKIDNNQGWVLSFKFHDLTTPLLPLNTGRKKAPRSRADGLSLTFNIPPELSETYINNVSPIILSQESI
jgi:hypothetical protein